MIEVLENNKLNIRYGEDWVKFKFSYEYSGDINEDEIFRYDLLTDECKAIFNDIFHILKLKYVESDEITYSKRWGRIYKYGNMTLCVDPADFMADKENGKRYMIFELSGDGCREFERRGGSAIEILTYISCCKNLEFYRLDIATDLFTDKYFSQEDLIMKVVNKEYVSTLKSPKDNFDITNMQGILNNAWSFTWGKHGSNQFVIYNKAVEMKKKLNKKDMLEKFWIRFEIRFVGDSAKLVGRQLANAYGNGNVGDFVSSLLQKKIKFIKQKELNLSRDSEMWENWNEFLLAIGNNQEVITSFKSQIDDVPTMIYRWYNWLAENVRATLQKLYLISPESFDNLMSKIIKVKPYETIPNIKKNELRVINECRNSLGYQSINYEDICSLLCNIHYEYDNFVATLDDYGSSFATSKTNSEAIKEQVFDSLEKRILEF